MIENIFAMFSFNNFWNCSMWAMDDPRSFEKNRGAGVEK